MAGGGSGPAARCLGAAGVRGRDARVARRVCTPRAGGTGRGYPCPRPREPAARGVVQASGPESASGQAPRPTCAQQDRPAPRHSAGGCGARLQGPCPHTTMLSPGQVAWPGRTGAGAAWHTADLCEQPVNVSGCPTSHGRGARSQSRCAWPRDSLCLRGHQGQPLCAPGAQGRQAAGAGVRVDAALGARGPVSSVKTRRSRPGRWGSAGAARHCPHRPAKRTVLGPGTSPTEGVAHALGRSA